MTDDPMPPEVPEPAPAPGEAASVSAPVGDASADRPARPRRGTPVVRWIRGLSQAAYVGILVLVIALLVLVAAVVNPGEQVGPVRPADPPVGGPGLPATRL